MAGKFIPFEKSSKDKEPKGMKEGSKKEVALDKKQAGKKPLPAFMAGKKR